MSYKTETHLHTKESSYCSQVSAEEMMHLYKEKGYKTVIITNHYSMGNLNIPMAYSWEERIDYLLLGYKNAQKLSSSLSMNVLFGIELTLYETRSDYLIYGITEQFLKENKHLYNLTLKELVDICKNNNFLIVEAHPFRDNMELVPLEFNMPIEVYNGCHDVNSRNELAKKYVKENKLIGISGSDFHHINDLARGGIITDTEIKTIQDYINVVLENKFEMIT